MDEFKKKLRELLDARILMGRFRFTKQKMIINDLQNLALDINGEADVKTCTDAVEKVRNLMGTNSFLLRDIENYLMTDL